MPNLADYMDLRAEVVRLVKVPSIIDNLDNTTKAAERWIGRNLRHRKQITTASVTFTDGRAALPADFLEMLNIYNGAGWTYAQAPLGVVENASAGGSYFAVDDADVIIPGLSGAHDIQYYAALPTITGNLTSTNWCLASYPELYLYAAAFEAGAMVANPEVVGLIEAMRDRQLREAKIDSTRAQYGAGRVRVGGVIA